MNPIRIGVICPSEIAFRRFMPAVIKLPDLFKFEGLAIACPEEWFDDLSSVSKNQVDEQQNRELIKANEFVSLYNGKIFHGYEALIKSTEIDAIYIPLPPALHFKWAKLALEYGKHVMLEKPSTTCFRDTNELVSIAKNKKLALHENYMFVFHDQLKTINEVVKDGTSVGTPRLYRISFGFPRRGMNDFRYNKSLGGGALLDAGGYTMRYATELLGKSARVATAQANYDEDFEVEIFGSATMVNDEGTTAQLAFGMDNDYRCDIEVWGSKGTLTSNRILTAPSGCVPKYILKQNQTYTEHILPEDDAFLKSLQHFAACISDETIRDENYEILNKQASLVQQFIDITGV